MAPQDGRHRRVLELTDQGRSVAQIAEETGLSPRTITRIRAEARSVPNELLAQVASLSREGEAATGALASRLTAAVEKLAEATRELVDLAVELGRTEARFRTIADATERRATSNPLI